MGIEAGVETWWPVFTASDLRPWAQFAVIVATVVLITVVIGVAEGKGNRWKGPPPK